MLGFLQQLFESGRLLVEPMAVGAASPAEDAATRAAVWSLLQGVEADYRTHLCEVPPPLLAGPAMYGATMLHRACQLLVYREASAADVEQAIVIPAANSQPVASVSSASEHYGVDLCLRFLPDVLRLARGVATDDPLVARLLQLARCWPLSSVGISGVGTVEIKAFADDPCLWQLYIDRVLARSDASRMADPAVQAAVAAAVGGYPELAGKLKVPAS